MLSFENEGGRIGRTGHYLPKIKITNYSVNRLMAVNFFLNQKMMIQDRIKALEKLLLAKEIIPQLVVYLIIFISKNISYLQIHEIS